VDDFIILSAQDLDLATANMLNFPIDNDQRKNGQKTNDTKRNPEPTRHLQKKLTPY
jgi:hypothetical protein